MPVMDLQNIPPENSVLHCNAYPEVDVPMSAQQHMRYERKLVSVAREMIENLNCHARDAIQNIQEEMERETGLTVSTDMLLSNIKDIMLRYRSNGAAVRGTCSASMPHPCPFTGSLLCYCTSGGFGPTCHTCKHAADSHRPLEENWDQLISREFAGPREFPGALNRIEMDQKSKTLLVVGDNNCLPNTTFVRDLEARFMVQNLSVDGINSKGALVVLNDYLRGAGTIFGVVLVHLLNNDSVYPDSEVQKQITDEECNVALARDSKWPRDAGSLHIHQSARMLSNIASVSEFYLKDSQTSYVPRIIFVPPLIPTDMEWYGPGRLRRGLERSSLYRDRCVELAKSMGCEVVDIPWPDGSKDHQCGVLLTAKGGEQLAAAVEKKVLGA